LLASGQKTTLYFFPGATLKGGGMIGMIGMTGDVNNTISGAFTNVDNNIFGAGVIAATINNQAGGVIDANSSIAPLSIIGPLTNAGFLEARDGGELDISANVIDEPNLTNKNSGVIDAVFSSGLSSTVALIDSRITGGTLTSGGGEIDVRGNTTLDGSNFFLLSNKMITLDTGVFVAPNGIDVSTVAIFGNPTAGSGIATAPATLRSAHRQS
jgi:hypothetical protein